MSPAAMASSLHMRLELDWLVARGHAGAISLRHSCDFHPAGQVRKTAIVSAGTLCTLSDRLQRPEAAESSTRICVSF